MAWYGDNWSSEQRSCSRDQAANERQVWGQHMEGANHTALQHFQNFTPYNMVNASSPPFCGIKLPDSLRLNEQRLLGNNAPSTSTKSLMPVEDLNKIIPIQMQMTTAKAHPDQNLGQPPQQKFIPGPSSKPAQLPKQGSHKKLPKSKPKQTSREKAIKGEETKKKRKKKSPKVVAVDECEAPYQCKICEKLFEFEASLRTHLLLHAGVFYKQPPIEAPIPQKAKSKKDAPKIFQCTQCEEAFSQSRALERHMKTHGGKSLYKCPTCEKTYSCSAGLKRHLFSHTGKKPFVCKVCNKTFAFKEYLLRHMKTHTEIRPYKCTICIKTFVLEKNLKNHLKAHSVAQPFRCNVCNGAFSQQANLYRHMRAHTGQ